MAFGRKRKKVSPASKKKISLSLARRLGPTRGYDPYEAVGDKPGKGQSGKSGNTPTAKKNGPATAGGGGGNKPPKKPNAGIASPAPDPDEPVDLGEDLNAPIDDSYRDNYKGGLFTKGNHTPKDDTPDNTVSGGGRQASPDFLLPEKIRQEKGYQKDLTTLRNGLASGDISPAEFVAKYNKRVAAAKKDQGPDVEGGGHGRNRAAQRQASRMRTLGQDAGVLDKKGNPKSSTPAGKASQPNEKQAPAAQKSMKAPESIKGSTKPEKGDGTLAKVAKTVDTARVNHAVKAVKKYKINLDNARLKYNRGLERHPGMDHTSALKRVHLAEQELLHARKKQQKLTSPDGQDGPVDFYDAAKALRKRQRHERLIEVKRRENAIANGAREGGERRASAVDVVGDTLVGHTGQGPKGSKTFRHPDAGQVEAAAAQRRAIPQGDAVDMANTARENAVATEATNPTVATRATASDNPLAGARKLKPDNRNPNQLELSPENDKDRAPDVQAPDVQASRDTGIQAPDAQAPAPDPEMNRREAEARAILEMRGQNPDTWDAPSPEVAALMDDARARVRQQSDDRAAQLDATHRREAEARTTLEARGVDTSDWEEASPAVRKRMPEARQRISDDMNQTPEGQRLAAQNNPAEVARRQADARDAGHEFAPAEERRKFSAFDDDELDTERNAIVNEWGDSLNDTSPMDIPEEAMARDMAKERLSALDREIADRGVENRAEAAKRAPNVDRAPDVDAPLPQEPIDPEQVAAERARILPDMNDPDLADIAQSDKSTPGDIKDELARRQYDQEYNPFDPNPADTVGRGRARTSDTALAERDNADEQREIAAFRRDLDGMNDDDLDDAARLHSGTPYGQAAMGLLNEREQAKDYTDPLREGGKFDKDIADLTRVQGDKLIDDLATNSHMSRDELEKEAALRGNDNYLDAFSSEHYNWATAQQIEYNKSLGKDDLEESGTNIPSHNDRDALKTILAAEDRVEGTGNAEGVNAEATGFYFDHVGYIPDLENYVRGLRGEKPKGPTSIDEIRYHLNPLMRNGIQGRDNQGNTYTTRQGQRAQAGAPRRTAGQKETERTARIGNKATEQAVDWDDAKLMKAAEAPAKGADDPIKQERYRFEAMHRGLIPKDESFEKFATNRPRYRDGNTPKPDTTDASRARQAAPPAPTPKKQPVAAVPAKPAPQPSTPAQDELPVPKTHQVLGGKGRRISEADAAEEMYGTNSPEHHRAKVAEAKELHGNNSPEHQAAQAAANKPRPKAAPVDTTPKGEQGTLAGIEDSAVAAIDGGRELPGLDAVALKNPEKGKKSEGGLLDRALAQSAPKEGATPKNPARPGTTAPDQGTGKGARALTAPEKAPEATVEADPYTRTFNAVRDGKGKDDALANLADDDLTAALAEAQKPTSARGGSHGKTTKQRLAKAIQAEQDRRLTPEQRDTNAKATKKQADEQKAKADRVAAEKKAKVEADRAAAEKQDAEDKKVAAEARKRLSRLETEHGKGANRTASDDDLLAAAKGDSDEAYLAERELMDRGYKGNRKPSTDLRAALDLRDGRISPEYFRPNELEGIAKRLEKQSEKNRPKVANGGHGQPTAEEMGVKQLAGIVRRAAKDRTPDPELASVPAPRLKDFIGRKVWGKIDTDSDISSARLRTLLDVETVENEHGDTRYIAVVDDNGTPARAGGRMPTNTVSVEIRDGDNIKSEELDGGGEGTYTSRKFIFDDDKPNLSGTDGLKKAEAPKKEIKDKADAQKSPEQEKIDSIMETVKAIQSKPPKETTSRDRLDINIAQVTLPRYAVKRDESRNPIPDAGNIERAKKMEASTDAQLAKIARDGERLDRGAATSELTRRGHVMRHRGGPTDTEKLIGAVAYGDTSPDSLTDDQVNDLVRYADNEWQIGKEKNLGSFTIGGVMAWARDEKAARTEKRVAANPQKYLDEMGKPGYKADSDVENALSKALGGYGPLKEANDKRNSELVKPDGAPEKIRNLVDEPHKVADLSDKELADASVAYDKHTKGYKDASKYEARALAARRAIRKEISEREQAKKAKERDAAAEAAAGSVDLIQSKDLDDARAYIAVSSFGNLKDHHAKALYDARFKGQPLQVADGSLYEGGRRPSKAENHAISAGKLLAERGIDPQTGKAPNEPGLFAIQWKARGDVGRADDADLIKARDELGGIDRLGAPSAFAINQEISKRGLGKKADAPKPEPEKGKAGGDTPDEIDALLERLNSTYEGNTPAPDVTEDPRTLTGTDITPEQARPGDTVTTPYGDETIIGVGEDVVTTTVNGKRDDAYTFGWGDIDKLTKNGDVTNPRTGSDHYNIAVGGIGGHTPQPTPKKSVDAMSPGTFYTRKQLAERGWTKAQIDKEIGTPDSIARRYKQVDESGEMFHNIRTHLFSRDRVHLAEKRTGKSASANPLKDLQDKAQNAMRTVSKIADTDTDKQDDGGYAGLKPKDRALKVYDDVIAGEAFTTSEIMEETGLSRGQVLADLHQLERGGLIGSQADQEMTSGDTKISGGRDEMRDLIWVDNFRDEADGRNAGRQSYLDTDTSKPKSTPTPKVELTDEEKAEKDAKAKAAAERKAKKEKEAAEKAAQEAEAQATKEAKKAEEKAEREKKKEAGGRTLTITKVDPADPALKGDIENLTDDQVASLMVAQAKRDTKGMNQLAQVHRKRKIDTLAKELYARGFDPKDLKVPFQETPEYRSRQKWNAEQAKKQDMAELSVSDPEAYRQSVIEDGKNNPMTNRLGLLEDGSFNFRGGLGADEMPVKGRDGKVYTPGKRGEMSAMSAEEIQAHLDDNNLLIKDGDGNLVKVTKATQYKAHMTLAGTDLTGEKRKIKVNTIGLGLAQTYKEATHTDGTPLTEQESVRYGDLSAEAFYLDQHAANRKAFARKTGEWKVLEEGRDQRRAQMKAMLDTTGETEINPDTSTAPDNQPGVVRQHAAGDWDEPYSPGDDYVVWNAQRPLRGEHMWEGDSRYGRHYAAVRKDSPRAAEFNKANAGLDAERVELIDNATAIRMAENKLSDSPDEQVRYADLKEQGITGRQLAEMAGVPWSDNDTSHDTKATEINPAEVPTADEPVTFDTPAKASEAASTAAEQARDLRYQAQIARGRKRGKNSTWDEKELAAVHKRDRDSLESYIRAGEILASNPDAENYDRDGYVKIYEDRDNRRSLMEQAHALETAHKIHGADIIVRPAGNREVRSIDGVNTTSPDDEDFVIRHTPDGGTLIEGTSRGDGTAEVLKAQGWKWSRNLGAWYVPHSRDKRPGMRKINATSQALIDAGHTSLGHDIENGRRDMADIEADKASRQEDRVDALENKAGRKASQAEGAWGAHDSAVQRLPYGAEPVKIGHHSENRHRRDIKRAWDSMGKAVEAEREAERVRGKADAAKHTTEARYNPVTVRNRVKKLEADQRGVERDLLGTGTTGSMDDMPAYGAGREALLERYFDIDDELAYWQGVADHQAEQGKAVNVTPETVKPGDKVKTRGRWYEVMKVNKATIDLAYPDRDGQTRPYRTEHAEVVGHKPMTDEERTAFEAKQTEAAAVPDDRDVDGNIDHRPGSRILKKHAAEGETYERGKIKRHGFTIANGGNGSYEIHDPAGNRHFGGFLNANYNSLSGTRGMVDKMKEDRDILGRDSKLLGESDERLKQFAAGYNEVSAKDATDLIAARKRKADTAAMPSIPTKANLAPRRRLAEHLATPEGKQEAREMIAELTKGDYAADSARADAVKSIARKLGISDEQMAGLESWQDDFNWSRISRMKDPAKIEAALGDLVDGGDTPDTPEAPTPTPKHVKGQPFTDGHLDEGEAISAGGNIRRGDYAIASTEDGYRVIEQFDSHRAMVNKFKTLAAARKKVDAMQAQRGPAAVEKSILAEFPDLRLMPEGQLALVANGNGNKADAARRLLAARKDA